MKGRLYDPVLRRFTTADPYVTEPLNPQGLNRYSYVQNNPMNFTDPSGFDSMQLTIQTGQGTQVISVTIPDMQVSYAPTMPSPQQMADWGNTASNSAGQAVQEQHAGLDGDLSNQASARALDRAQAQNATIQDMYRAHDAAFPANTAETNRSAATNGKGNPICSAAPIRLNEPLADSQVQTELWKMYNRSDLGSMRAHEEGIVSRGNWQGDRLVLDDIVRANPSITLAQARRLRETPELARMPTLPDSPHADAYFDAHSHPFLAGTYLYTTDSGLRMLAAPGASPGDVWSNVLLTATGRNAFNYVVAPEGIYRIYGGECNLVAPIVYINPGK